MRFVHDENCPIDGPEASGVDGNQLVTGQEHVEFDGTGTDSGRSAAADGALFEGHLVLADYRTRVLVTWKQNKKNVLHNLNLPLSVLILVFKAQNILTSLIKLS